MKLGAFHRQVGYLLLVSSLGLIAIGLVMLASAGGKFVLDRPSLWGGLLVRQLAWVGLGGITCGILARWDYHWFLHRSAFALALAFFCLLGCFVPGLGHKVHGSWRWIEVAGWRFQPSELAKGALVVFLAAYLGHPNRKLSRFTEACAIPVAATLLLAGPILVSRDLGSVLFLLLTLGALLFCAGCPARWWVPVPVAGFLATLVFALAIPERRARIVEFFRHGEDHLGKGYQIYQALIALGSGGTQGLGLGNSRQKMYYLPESTTDFIFPIIGEELGLWFALSVVFAYVLVVLCGGWISLHAPDRQGILLGTGLTLLVGAQAVANLGVVTGLLPNKGLPLPFVSYGGSNLLLCMGALGILFNLQRQAQWKDDEDCSLPERYRQSVRI
ncbi:FtsW/RodA/SpoVE family cell cycle protein [Candidatus Methylacidithermus pantelleriae]|uniref:Probable peptidoglycan glycosyltransferase FtsW n=1 Tax=Candidatus Methylacidithermus pantelleriae TaxID=2744239 RepID=A0A8J2FNT2_9BACT|nr:putative peptidoglycan glycosyltransferase FtsW [Candidatus Methylacidithermus pantelleriae]CAF0694982.1 Cell division protein FtsW [Candidatus Methylacidithermus pantelleriae]